ncbi:MAG TPA: dethiobiotin synthase [Rhizomicrobium sp.]|nr:dethiobiotin synthase [Rhizomicrobium sp.]
MNARRFIVSGTGTGVGKTIFAAALTQALKGVYWKPVQSGLAGETDSETVARLSGRPVLPEAYRLKLPAAPHKSAAAEGITIEIARLALPATDAPLIVEGAGGLMVPLTGEILFIDLFKQWDAPLILCAHTSLGIINQALLSLEAIRTRNIPLLGLAFIGDANDDSERAIVQFGKVKRLGRLAGIAPMTPENLGQAFAAGFDLKDFR